MKESETIEALGEFVVVKDPEIIDEQIIVPVDMSKIERLTRCFIVLSNKKQDWLLTRFPGCDTDKDACEVTKVSQSVLGDWKRKDMDFLGAYNLLASGCVDFAAHLARRIDQGNAVLAAREVRKLVEMDWKADVDSARLASAKATACNQALERTLGKKVDITGRTVRMEDLEDA